MHPNPQILTGQPMGIPPVCPMSRILAPHAMLSAAFPALSYRCGCCGALFLLHVCSNNNTCNAPAIALVLLLLLLLLWQYYEIETCPTAIPNRYIAIGLQVHTVLTVVALPGFSDLPIHLPVACKYPATTKSTGSRQTAP